MELINKTMIPPARVTGLAQAVKYRADNAKYADLYVLLSFWFYSSNGKEKEICIDSFNDDSELTDENIFTETEPLTEYQEFDWETGEQMNRKGEKLKDLKNIPDKKPKAKKARG